MPVSDALSGETMSRSVKRTLTVRRSTFIAVGSNGVLMVLLAPFGPWAGITGAAFVLGWTQLAGP